MRGVLGIDPISRIEATQAASQKGSFLRHPEALAGERIQVHSTLRDTLADRLNYLGRNYIVFLGPLILLQGVGYATTSSALVWASSGLIALLVLNKIRMMRRGAGAPR